MKNLADFVVFNDPGLARRLAGNKPAMSALCEAYLNEAVDIVDLDGFFDARAELVDYSLTLEHVKQFVTRMVPEWTLHSLAQDRRIVRQHYDRGDDFFAAFLGERMVYTSGIFHDETQSLEQGQDNKLDLVCQKIGRRGLGGSVGKGVASGLESVIVVVKATNHDRRFRQVARRFGRSAPNL